MADALDPTSILAKILAEHGPLSDDDVVQRLRQAGVADADAAVGARFAAMVDPDEPVYFDAVVWTVCAEDPALFTQPLAPLSEIVDDAGLPYDDDRLAPAGFDFDVWRFNLGCARLVRQYD